MRRGTLRLRLDELESRTVPSSPGDIDWLRQFGSSAPAGGQGRAVDADGNAYVAGQVAGALPGQSSAGDFDAFVRKYDAAGNEIWTRQFGTGGADSAQAVFVDGSFVYVAGFVRLSLPGQSTVGDTDAYLRKYDSAGNEIWTRQFGTDHIDQASCLAVDGSGVYVAGYTDLGNFPGFTNQGGRDVFVRKYDAGGTALWTRQFGTPTFDEALGVTTDASGVYVAGYIQGVLSSNPDAFVRKYDAGGTELWTRVFGGNVGGTDEALGVAVDASGVYVTGFVSGALPGQTSAGGIGNDAFVRKYDTAGNELWTRQFGSPVGDNATGVAVDTTGVYVTGFTIGALPGQTNLGSNDVFVRKYDGSGSEVWTRQFGQPGTDDAFGVATDTSGVYVTGLMQGPSSSDVFLRKFDTGGNEVWSRQFSGFRSFTDVARAVDADGNVYVTGQVAGPSPGQSAAGGVNAFVRKYDAAGNDLWTREFGSDGPDSASGIAVDDSGVYVAGYVFGTLPGQTGLGGQDAFVRKYDADGNVIWTRQFGAPGTTVPFNPNPDDSASGIAADATGVYLVGATTGTFAGQTGAGGQDAFVRKYDAAGNELWTRQLGSTGGDQALGVTADASVVYVSGFVAGVIAGQTSAGGQDAFVRAYDSSGNTVWTRQFGTAGTDSAAGIAADTSGVYVGGSTAGTFAGQASAGGTDAFVRKYDLGGTASWTRQFGTTGPDQANGIAVGSTGVYVAGFVAGALPGRSGAGGQDAFVRKYDAAGAVIWTGQFGTAATDSASGVNVGASGLYVAGFTSGTFPGQTSAGLEDVFVARIVDTVSNTPPSNVSLHLPAGINEGGTATLTGSFTDPDAADTHTVVINWGAGEGTTTLNLAAGVTAFSATHTYLDDNPTGSASDVFAVTATVTDPAGGSATASVAITVNNLAPAVTVTGPAPTGVYTVGTPVVLTGSFTDAGAADTHAAQWVVGGVTLAGSVTESGGSGMVADGYTFSAAGAYTVRLTITDDDGGVGTDQITITVIGRPTTTTVSTSMTAPLFGVDGEILAAAVSAVQSGVGTPTGTVTFYEGNSKLGTIDLVNGSASLALGSTALSVGSHTIRAVYSGDSGFAGSESTVVSTVLAPSAIQGLVYVDFNNDGQVDFGERAVVDAAITLTGTDDLGNAVSRTVQTDGNGIYAFANLRPSNASGYSITETQPADLLDGRETTGTVNGVTTGSAAVSDIFSGIVLSQGGSIAENYNFGERPATTGGVAAGQTATIGFWQNRNGQNLLTAVNGGASATQLGHWLARSFPNMYASLDGMTNAQVAAYYKTLFARTSLDSPGGPPKVDAQVMATAFAAYVTNQTLSGTTAGAYGFQVTADGLGARTFNVGGNGAAFGATDNSDVSVMDLLLAADARSHNGLLFDANGDGQVNSSELADRTLANVVFTGINEAGDI